MSKVGSGDSKNTLYCSFCGKSQHEVRKLIAGPVDKISRKSDSPSITRASGEGVQQALLKIMETHCGIGTASGGPQASATGIPAG